jgi:putative transposon-encoded protein
MPAFRRSIRVVAVAAVAAAATFTASAAAETPSGTSTATPPPACAPGVLPTREHPCKLPPCLVAILPTAANPCLLPLCLPAILPTPIAPCARPLPPGTTPGQEKPGNPGATGNTPNPGTTGKPGTTGDQPGTGAPKAGEHGEPAPLMGGFLSRVWRFTADADSYDPASNTLNVTVNKIANLPNRYKTQDDEIVDKDADVVFTKSTKVFGADGKRVRVESDYDAALDNADTVAVTGKITPRSKWNKDEDGTPVTTVRAKRVKITG